jgi:hypothetical protein
VRRWDRRRSKYRATTHVAWAEPVLPQRPDGSGSIRLQTGSSNAGNVQRSRSESALTQLESLHRPDAIGQISPRGLRAAANDRFSRARGKMGQIQLRSYATCIKFLAGGASHPTLSQILASTDSARRGVLPAFSQSSVRTFRILPSYCKHSNYIPFPVTRQALSRTTSP